MKNTGGITILKKLTIILALLLIFSSSGCLAEEKLTEEDKLCKEDFKINGIKLEQPISEVISKLGKPDKVEKLSGEDGILDKDFYFGEIIISTFKYSKRESIGYIIIKRENIETYRGVKIGDSIKDVFHHYGKNEIDNGIIFYESPFEVGNFAYMIGFVIKEDKVNQILLFCEPTT